ncbi:MAG: 6-phosphogluconolactonase, partial [Blastococcus sp.]|nr:6-phosphogluconolactonase [Blastococcus sp.]
PPPTRISLTFPAINRAAEVWLLVSGSAKAPAVAQAVAGADRHELPAAGVHGTLATRWLLDTDAASELSA